LIRRVSNQLGVAMVTVLFAGAALTVVSSAAAYVTIKEFRAGADDRRATEALAYAETGVDRLMLELRRGTFDWGRLNKAGCSEAPATVPEGDLGNQKLYNAYLTVYDPAQPLIDVGGWQPGAPLWDSTLNSSTALCISRLAADPQTPQLFAVTSTGEHPTATRVVRQIVKIGARGLPIGLYADNVNVQGGNPSVLDISLLTPGNVTNREKLVFTGLDPYYKLGHFWAGQSMTVPVPAAVHALGTISCRKIECGDDQVEHPTALECNANPSGQAQWDQSGGGGDLAGFAPCPAWAGSPLGPPPHSSFSLSEFEAASPKPKLDDQDYQNLEAAAKASGLYCVIGSSGSGTCTRAGTSFATNGTIQDADIAGLSKRFVAYVDFPASGDPFGVKATLTWKATVAPCDDDSAIRRSVVLVVRYGSLDLTGQGEMVGAFLAPEGQVWIRGVGGTVKVHGTTIAKKLDFGGNAEVINSACWVRNMPGGFLSYTPQAWSEVDR
jgi:hypothetical protein